jgi:hypothetical protein
MTIEIYSDLTLEDIGFPPDGDYDEGVGQLKGSVLEDYCQRKITRDFIEYQLEYVKNSILLIQKHGNTIRGFALLRSGDDLELVILCAAERPTMELRSGSVPGGTELLKLTKKIGKNYPQVTLYALEGVVSLYHKFGFQLDGNPRYDSIITEFYEFLRTKPSDEEIDKFLSKSQLTQFGKNYYLNVSNSGIDDAVKGAREDGFYMIWNPHATGGSKRKRKSRKNLKKRTKKNLKKRTKKKTLRKRKTRKHRGGGEFTRNKGNRKGFRNTKKIHENPAQLLNGEPVYARLDLEEPLYKNVPGTKRLREKTLYASVVGTTTQGPFKN